MPGADNAALRFPLAHPTQPEVNCQPRTPLHAGAGMEAVKRRRRAAVQGHPRKSDTARQESMRLCVRPKARRTQIVQRPAKPFPLPQPTPPESCIPIRGRGNVAGRQPRFPHPHESAQRNPSERPTPRRPPEARRAQPARQARGRVSGCARNPGWQRITKNRTPRLRLTALRHHSPTVSLSPLTPPSQSASVTVQMDTAAYRTTSRTPYPLLEDGSQGRPRAITRTSRF